MGGTQNSCNARSTFDGVSDLLHEMMQTITEPVRVREEVLANHLGVSRTPVREALIRLESTGMVRLRPGRSALLSPVTNEEYIEWLQLREQMEGFACREAAKNASQRDVQRLFSIFIPFVDLDHDSYPKDAYAQANVEFHKAIISLAHNSLLTRMWAMFGHRQTTYKRHTIHNAHRFSQSLREHLAIIKAIEQRNFELSETLGRQHVRSLHDDFINSLSGLRRSSD